MYNLVAHAYFQPYLPAFMSLFFDINIWIEDPTCCCCGWHHSVCTSGLAESLYCSVQSPCWASSAPLWPLLHPGPSLPCSSTCWAWVRSPAMWFHLYWVWPFHFYNIVTTDFYPYKANAFNLKKSIFTTKVKTPVLYCWRGKEKFKKMQTNDCPLVNLSLTWLMYFYLQSHNYFILVQQLDNRNRSNKKVH